MRSHLRPSTGLHAFIDFTNDFASRTAKKAIVTISLLACAFFGIEGGYQLHLSHDHPALSCAEAAMAASADNQIDAVPSFVSAPPCRAPDELGQGWRLRLVLRDMIGFLVFGSVCIAKSKALGAAVGSA